jgi:transcription initiation factor TFIIIB Brf1 subunit/transcription initiation factor TFIIB
MFQLTEITEEMAHQIFINEVEINRLKNELGMPNDITNQAEEIFNVLAEENVE